MSSSTVPPVIAVPAPDADSATSCLDRRCLLVATAVGAAALLSGCSMVEGQQSATVSPSDAVGTATPAAPAGTAPAAGMGSSAGMGSPAGMAPAGAGSAMAGSPAAMGSAAGAGMAPATAKAAPRVTGQVLAPLADVPVGGGIVLPAAKLVLTQPTAGTVLGFSAICTHMQCLVNQVANGTINCPCHGSMYNIADGSVAGGPAPAPLPRVQVAVQGGSVVKV